MPNTKLLASLLAFAHRTDLIATVPTQNCRRRWRGPGPHPRDQGTSRILQQLLGKSCKIVNELEASVSCRRSRKLGCVM